MYKISDKYKEIIYSGDARHKLRLFINGVELEDADVYCEKLTVKSRIIPNGSKILMLDNFVSKEAELILHDVNIDNILGQIEISIGTLVNEEYEYVPIGIFNINGTPTTDGKKTTLKLRDNSVKLDNPYNAKPLLDSNGGIATKKQILNDICYKFGIQNKVKHFLGENDEIGIYDNSINARIYVAYIAEQSGCIATIDRDGGLIFVELNKEGEVEIVSDKFIYINDSLERNASSYNIKGKSEQETRSGNLFTSMWIQGNIDGTTGNNIEASNTIRTDFIEVKPNNLYTMTRNVATSYNAFRFYDKNKNFLGNQTTDGMITSNNTENRMPANVTSMTFTVVNENVTYIRLIDTSNDLTTIYTMTTNTPSPDYPSEIKTIKGVRNLFDKDNPNILKAYLNSGKLVADDNTYLVYVPCKPNTTYTIQKIVSSRFVIYGTIEKPIIGVSGVVYGDTIGDKIVVKTNGTTNYLMIMYYKPNIDTLTEEQIRSSIMVEEGLIAHDCVPYGSWLKTEINNENLFDGLFSQGAINPNNGELSPDKQTWAITTTNLIEVKPNTTYRFFCNSDKQTLIDRIATFDKNKNFISRSNSLNTNIIETDSDTYFIRFNLYYANGITPDDVGEPLFKEGTEETEYKPHQKQEVLIDMNKPNLFDKSSIPTVTDGATVEEIDTGVKIISTKNGQVGSAYHARYLLFNIENLAGKEITISSDVVCSSINHGCLNLGTCDNEGNNRTSLKFIDQLTSGYHKMSVTLPNTITNTNKYLYVVLYSNRSDVDSVAGDYVEYNNLKIYEGYDSYYELSSINEKDNLEVVSGVLTKKIGKVVLDGSDDETYVYVSNNSVNGYSQFNYTANLSVPNAENYGENVISSHFEYYKEASTNLKEKAGIRIRSTNPYIVFSIEDTLASTVAEFKTWLSNNPVTVYYVLAQEETIQLTPTNIPLFEGYNEVSLVEDLDTETSIEYSQKKLKHKLPIELVEKYTNDVTYKISKVEYEDAIRKYSAGDGTGDALYLDTANPYISSQEQINEIYNRVKGFKINSFTTGKIIGNPAIDPYDVISITDYDGTEYNTLATNDFIYNGVCINTFATEIGIEERKTNVTVNGEDSFRRWARTEIDNVNAEIRFQAGEIEETNKNIEENYYQKSSVEQLILNAENGVTNTFSEAGGNNIFRNTNFSAQEVLEEGQYYEFWYGNVSRETNNNSANGYSILLQNNNLNQEQIVANGNYTVSFIYKKTNPLSKVFVKINGTSYELTENEFTLFQTGLKDEDGNYIVNPIVISDNHIKIEFETDIDNSCEIYDIMCNAGTVKLAYSQNANETTTDTVNIGKGITITSSTSDVQFVANNSSIKTENKNSKEIITEFTDKGMKTKEAEIENEAIIVGILRQKVKDQVWDSII